jgi:hypothetical protein
MKQNETNLGEKGEKGEPVFHCIFCDYKCCLKFSYDRHLLTAKHLKQTQMKQNETKKEKKEKKEKNEQNTCNCGLVYYSRTSLWRHKKKCPIIEKSDNNQENNEENIEKKDEIINFLMKENQDFKNLILEIIKKDTITNNNNIINTNSHNKTFNLNVFLNETCKDAMNIMEFVDSLKIELSDLENVGNVGYVNGISTIIVKNLNLLDETKRPVHCTDSKREVLYVKDQDKWEKENEDKSKMRKVIKHVTHKNTKLFKEFKIKYPGCEKSESKYSTKYDKLIVEAFGGKGDNDLEKEDKIIRNIAKTVTIDKK